MNNIFYIIMDKIIDSFKNIKRANNKLENNNYIKIRCEYKKIIKILTHLYI